jgi:hypothetical protein
VVLSKLQRLPVNEKRQWLETTEGKTQLRRWLSEGLSLIKIANLMQKHNTTLYGWCDRNPDLSEITGRPLVVTGSKPMQEDLSQSLAYRLISYISPCGKVLSEYATPDDAWNDWRIQLLLKTVNNYDREQYYQSYLKGIGTKGRYPLSNAVHVVYCSISQNGVFKIIKPPS